MREVTDLEKIERVVADVIHVLSERYGISVDKVGWLIAEYSMMMSGYLEKQIVVSKN